VSVTSADPAGRADCSRVEHDGLCDERGPIPMFSPRELDEHGRLIPLSPGERKARSEAAIRALRAIGKRPDTDPPGTAELVMRGIDEGRPHRPLFEGMY
jgi:hypothetical protein